MRTISDTTVRECKWVVDNLIRCYQQRDLPVNVESIAYELGVQIVEPASISIDGYVGKNCEGKTLIRYRRDNSLQRNRFTIAHEIAHLIIAKVVGQSIESRKMRIGIDHEEIVANRLAAEILMPTLILKQALSTHRPSWGFVHELRRLFNVSAFALLRRTTEIDGIASVFGRFSGSQRLPRQQKWFACDYSENPMMYFAKPLCKLVQQQLVSLGGTQFYVPAEIDGRVIDLPCEIRPAVDQKHRENWIYGWSSQGAVTASSS